MRTRSPVIIGDYGAQTRIGDMGLAIGPGSKMKGRGNMTRKQQRETGKSLHQQDVNVERSRFHRLARAGFYVILAGAITAGGVLLFTLDSQDQAVALGEAMDPPMPEPGGARAWELEIPIPPIPASTPAPETS